LNNLLLAKYNFDIAPIKTSALKNRVTKQKLLLKSAIK
jgi:hypothetical protein